MADSKITDLLELTAIADDDVLAVVDVSELPKTTKQIKASNLVKNDSDVSANTTHRGRTDNPHATTKAQVGLGNADNTSDVDKPVSTAQGVAIGNVQTNLTNHENDTGNPHSTTKAQVGLGNADNTSDLNKPISTATQAALDTKAGETDFDNHASSTTNPHAVTKTQVGLGNADNTSDIDKPVSTAQGIAIGNVQTNLTNHENDTGNPHSTTKGQVGLGNVDNTSDVDKPISTAQQNEIDTKYDASNPNNYETPSQLTTRDDNNRARANHTGTQLAATISDFEAAIIAFNSAQDFLDTTQVNFSGAVQLRKSFTTDSKAIGRYRVAVDIQYEPAQNSTNDIMELRINGSLIGLYKATEPKDSGGDVRDKAYIVGYYNNTTVGSFDIEVWAGNGGGTTEINGVVAEVWRKS